jgi:predicted nucleic acid-binding protein
LVVDASFVLRLILSGPQQATCRDLMAEWARDGIALCAPTLWLYEITSALCKVVRLGELTTEEAQQALALVHGLGVQVVPPDEFQTRRAFEWTMRLQRAAAYDSFYLALAEARRCELWTADKRLCHAVGQPWVHGVGDN